MAVPVVFDSIKMILVAKALATCSAKCLVVAADGIRQVRNAVATLKPRFRSALLKP